MNSPLAERSRTAFAARFPAIAARLARPAEPTSSVVVEDGEPVDILVGERRVYGGDARRLAAEQVAAFMAKPLRLFMDRPSSAGLVSPICVRLLEAMTGRLVEDGIDEISLKPVDSPTFLVVFGLGLGHHIEALTRGIDARWLIVVEPFVEFVEHSFGVVDWAALCERFEAKGGAVHLITEIDPGQMTSAIVGFMAAQGIPYVDGAWVFTHYPLWAFTEGRKRLYEAVEFAFVNRGFFEDELKMMANAVENFAARPFRLLEGRPRLRRPEVAVVAGAGPSLDEGMATLRAIRDRVVLFSGGTALRPLLRNGIVPDFHCELENVEAVVDVLHEAARFGDLKQITLIASATVDPRVPPLFGQTIFFFRDSVSSTRILGRKHWPIGGAAPTCVNTAVSMAAFLGFTDLVLFGTDCGVRPGGDHHAKDTVYRDVGVWRKHADESFRYPMEVEGNFGGVAMTDWVYDSCRVMLAEVIQRRRLNVVNCSDGALIPGAVPRVPEAVEIPGTVIDRGALLAALEPTLPPFAPAAILAETDLAEVGRQADALFGALDELLGELGQGEADFAGAYRRIMDFVAEAGDRHGHTQAIVAGTLQALPRIAMFFGFRVGDPVMRRRLFDLFIVEFRVIAATMRERTHELFAGLATRATPPSAALAGD